LELIAARSDATEAELQEVFNMGCGFCCVVPATDADAAAALLGERHRGARVVGEATRAAGVVELPASGLTGRAGKGFE
jgi:phosphoribosylformylglycinamidine cyclo-ligase